LTKEIGRADKKVDSALSKIVRLDQSGINWSFFISFFIFDLISNLFSI